MITTTNRQDNIYNGGRLDNLSKIDNVIGDSAVKGMDNKGIEDFGISGLKQQK
jgi:hypothetical protein